MPFTFTETDFAEPQAATPLQFDETDFAEPPKKKALEDTRDKLRKQGENLSTLTDIIGSAERMIEPYTPEGILNQPTRAADALAGAKIPDQFAAGKSVASLPEPTGTGVGAGFGRVGVGFVNGLTTPESIVTLPFAAQSRVMLALFGGQMAKDLPGEIKNAVDVVQDPNATTADKVAAVGNPVVQAAMIAGLAKAPKAEPSGVKASAGEPESPPVEAASKPAFTEADFKSTEPGPSTTQPPSSAPAEPPAPTAGAASLSVGDVVEIPNQDGKTVEASYVGDDKAGNKLYASHESSEIIIEPKEANALSIGIAKKIPVEVPPRDSATVGERVSAPEKPAEAPQSEAKDFKTTLTPALMVDGKPITGGGTHSEIVANAGEHALATKDPAAIDLWDKLLKANDNESDHVFVDGMGDVKTRTEAMPILEKITGKKPTEPVQSQHIPDESKGSTSYDPAVLHKAAPIAKTIGVTLDGVQPGYFGEPKTLQFTWRPKNGDVPKGSPLDGVTFYTPENATHGEIEAAAKSKAADFGVPDYKQGKPAETPKIPGSMPLGQKPISEEPAPAPKLAPGEKGTGDMFKGQDQPFNLAGEKGVDTARAAAEKQKAEDAAKANAEFQASQPTLIGETAKTQSARKAAAEFTSLVLEHAPIKKWGSERTIADAMSVAPGKNNLGTVGIKGAIARNKGIKAVLSSAAKDLGIDPDKIGSEAYRAKHLPALKEYIANQEAEQSAGKILMEAAKHGVSGVSESLTGLSKLFGSKTRLGSLTPGFDEKTYAEAKPHFEKAWSEFKNTGKSVKEFTDFMVNSFGETIKPYVDQFLKLATQGKNVYGVAQRVREARAKAGQVAPVPTGEGVSAPDAVEWGRELFREGGDPEQSLNDIERTGAVSFDAAAITRAHGEGLAQVAADMEHEHGLDSPEYKAARQALDDWDTRTKALGTIWHKVGMAMQGETDLDTGSFTAMDRAFKDAHDGKEMTPEQQKKAKELVAENQKLAKENDALLAKLDAEISKQTPAPKVEVVEPHVKIVADKLRDYFKARSQSALDRIKARRAEGRLFTGIDPSELIDYADHGASKIFEKGIEGAEMTAEWADEMVKDIGEFIKPHLQQIWDASLKTFQYGFKKVVPGDAATRQKVKRAVKPKPPVDPESEQAAEAFRKAAVDLAEAESAARVADATAKKRANDVQRKAAEKARDAALKTVRDAAARAAEAETKARVAEAKAKKAAWAKSLDGLRSVMSEPKVNGKFSQEQIGALWDYVKKTHIDQGNTDFGDIVQKTSTELGMPWKDVADALGQSKTAKRLTDELYRKQTDRRRVSETAKRWVAAQDRPWLATIIPSAARRMFGLKVFGHGTVGFGTHAPLVAFMPQYAKVYYRDFGKMYAMVFNQARYEQEVNALKGGRNYDVAQRNGLVNDPFKVEDFNDPRIAQYYGKLSGAGNRGYFALKILRQDMFDQGWDRLPQNLKTDDMAKAMSDSINHLTGVVKGKGGSKYAHLALFAPRLLASRASFLFSDPAKAAVIISKLATRDWKDLPDHEKFIVLNELKTKATIAGTAFVLLAINQGILQAVGSNQQINMTDPTRSDFFKFKAAGMDFSFGNPVLNMARLPLRLWTIGRGDGGKLKHLIYPDEDMAHAVEEFGRTQLSPLAGLVADFLFKGDYQNRPLPQIPGYGAPIPVPKRLAAQGIKPYTWPEFAAQTALPIWANEAVTEVWRHGFGMSEDQIKSMSKALLATAVTAGTGGRLTEDTAPKKNVMQE